MKFSIKKEILLENLNNVSKAISSKNVIPVLGGIKFDLTEEGLNLTSTNNEIDIKCFIEKSLIENIDKVGSIVIQGKYLLEIVRKLPEGLINIEVVDDLKIILYTKNSTFNLNGISANEFPDLNIEKTSKPILLTKKLIRKIVNQTIFAASTQESRPILTGINLKIENDIMECLATDSYRLSKKVIKLNNTTDNIINVVIPSKNISELIKILSDDEEEVKIHIFSNKILFEFDNLLFQSRLLNGTFPDTSRLIPTEFKFEILANLEELYEVIDRASLLTSEKEKNVIKFETNGNILTISSNTPEIGRVEEKLSINKNISEDISIAFSSKYMMDALRTISDTNVKILLNSNITPIILNNENDENLVELLLPIKTY